MMLLRGSTATGTTFLVCLLLTGCGHLQGIHDGPPATNDLASQAAGSSEASSRLTDTSASPQSGMQPVAHEVEPSLPTGQPPTTESTAPCMVLEKTPQTVWGIAELRGFPVAQEVAANGAEYNALFMLGLDFNIMIWREQNLYLFADASFWGQKAAPGVTNAHQGSFDFSKREFDFNLGAAWNYSGPWEARAFGYSFNNLNRGTSQTSPTGFNDGFGIENRYYLSETYAHLGTAAFDEARATFLSIGYYPTRTMVDGNGIPFKPGPFARAYVTLDLWSEQYYLYGDIQFIASRSFQPTLLTLDAGVAARPFESIPRLEFRLGTQDTLDLNGGSDLETSIYLSIRYVF
jgi:hypothetical protein